MQTIYEPGARAREYSELALNIYTGCRFGCKYCFNKKMPWYNPAVFKRPKARTNIVQETAKAASKMAGDVRRVLLCFSCDPYPGEPLDLTTREILEVLEKYRMNVQILTKAGMRAVRDFDIIARNGWKFGTSISGSQDAINSWERKTACFYDRYLSLEAAKACGISTFVSVEPVIEPEYCLALMSSRGMRDVVDEWRVGKMNYEPDVEEKIDWRDFLERARKLLSGERVLFKQDLINAAQ